MSTIKIDFSRTVGKIKPMHAINNVPLLWANDSMFHFIGEAGIPYSRLHDTGGAYGGGTFVDIPNIFRNFDADENDPSSYDFAFTDWLLCAIHRQNTKIFYRLGVTIENYHAIQAYRIYPPKDNAKWARICEKIIAHYNEGWANGYHLGIEYWEIWNEPDNYPAIEDNCMWRGTFEQYLELYRATAPYLKEKFPHIKVGGFASCGFYHLFKNHAVKTANSSSRTEYFIECFEKFLAFVRDNRLPLDFFSWHSYSSVEKNIVYEEYVHSKLREYGLSNTESILNEWNPGIDKRGTLEDAANIAEMLMTMQNTTADMLMYYDGQVHGDYQGLFNPITHQPFPAYYVFRAFGVLYERQDQAEVVCQADNLSCLAATGNGKHAVLLTSKREGKHTISVCTDSAQAFTVYRLNHSLNLEETETLLPNENGETEIEIDRFETVLLVGKA